jgi:hypothetical protein
VNPGLPTGNAHAKTFPDVSRAATGSPRAVDNTHPNVINGCALARTTETSAVPPVGVVVVVKEETNTDDPSTTSYITSFLAI